MSESDYDGYVKRRYYSGTVAVTVTMAIGHADDKRV